MKEYASTLLGIALHARDARDTSRRLRIESTREEVRSLLLGRIMAMSDVLQWITGRQVDEEVDDIIRSMENRR